MAQVTFGAGANVSSLLRFAPPSIVESTTRRLTIKITSGSWTSANLGVQVSSDGGTNFYPLKMSGSWAGLSAGPTTFFDSFEIPRSADLVKLWSNDGSGNNTNQVNAIELDVLVS